MTFNAVPDVIKDEIKSTFGTSSPIPSLKVVDILEEMKDHAKDLGFSKCSFKDVLRHVFDLHKDMLLPESGNSWDLCYSYFNGLRMKRKSAGVLIKSPDNCILFVKNRNNDYFFPAGKTSFDDCDNLKTTALRECGEESSIWFDENEFSQIKNYMVFRNKGQMNKPMRIYIVDQPVDKKRTAGHYRLGEVKELVWLSEQQTREGKVLDEVDIQRFFQKKLQSCTDNSDTKASWEVYKNCKENEKKYILRKIRILGENQYLDCVKKFLKND